MTDLPRCLATPSPARLIVPEAEYEHRVVENEDQCIVDDAHFFVRGHIEIPVVDADGVFAWSVWVSLSEASFDSMCDSWEQVGRETNAPCFGWLMSSLPGYPETLELKTSVQEQPVGEVPLITLEPTDHPLAVEQRDGVRLVRLQAIVREALGH